MRSFHHENIFTRSCNVFSLVFILCICIYRRNMSCCFCSNSWYLNFSCEFRALEFDSMVGRSVMIDIKLFIIIFDECFSKCAGAIRQVVRSSRYTINRGILIMNVQVGCIFNRNQHNILCGKMIETMPKNQTKRIFTSLSVWIFHLHEFLSFEQQSTAMPALTVWPWPLRTSRNPFYEETNKFFCFIPFAEKLKWDCSVSHSKWLLAVLLLFLLAWKLIKEFIKVISVDHHLFPAKLFVLFFSHYRCGKLR